jgi:hypothetical protein
MTFLVVVVIIVAIFQILGEMKIKELQCLYASLVEDTLRGLDVERKQR